jgi:polyhydroxyalkanoate synthesis repressor PhaR
MPASKKTPSEDAGGIRVLKKYPNRRLYDTRTSSYITLADVKAMVLSGEPFEVRDAKSAEDLTRSILLQIILEEESGGVPLFTTQMLAQIIRFYGHSMQGLMGAMMEKNLQAFVELQGQIVENSKGLIEGRGFSHEMWAQAPVLQNLMGTYVEQSRTLFQQMQEQMKLPGSLFPGMGPFGPGKK